MFRREASSGFYSRIVSDYEDDGDDDGDDDNLIMLVIDFNAT